MPSHMPTGRTPRRPALLCRLHGDQGGQAIIVMVLFFLLLAAMVFLVINTGQLINRKVTVQSAADSVTASGAAWFARGMNIASMANVIETQLMSMILMLDSLETVAPVAVECIDDLVTHLGSSNAGRDIPLDDRTKDWLAVGNARSEQEIIHQFLDVVEAIPMPEYCSYDDGVLWECCKLMEGFSRVMIEVTPRAALREAIDVADKNHAMFGFVVPFWHELPVHETEFADFENPMRWGRLPPPRDKKTIGGFAHVMYYRAYSYHGWGRTLGPFEYYREPLIRVRPMGLMDLSRFSVLFTVVSDRKFRMLFGDTDDEVTLEDWEMVYDKAKSLSDEQVLRAWWERMSFDCRYEFPTSAFFSSMDLRHQSKPYPSNRYYGSMSRPNLSNYTRATEAYEGADARHSVWYRVQERWTAHYPELGIYAPHAPMRPDGSKWPYTQEEKQRYYHVDFWRFNGVEKETDHHLHRDYLPAAGETPPLKPVLLRPQDGYWTDRNIASTFTFNGFAYRPNEIKDFAALFKNPNPTEQLVGYAQARVYNRWSHDMFTQHWKVKLVKQDRWRSLLGLLEPNLPADAGDAGDQLTAERIEYVRQVIEAYQDPFVREVTH